MSNKKKAYIIYERYYDFDNKRVVSGGVQTYITNLITLLIESGFETNVYQFGKAESKIALSNCSVHVVPNSKDGERFLVPVVLENIRNDFNADVDLLIFADHILSAPNTAKHSISIQHGIHWDVSTEQIRSNLRMFLSKARFAYEEHKKISYVNHIVCVDYNFLNWYRTQVDMPKSNFSVIPNFTKISQNVEKSSTPIKIIFARRFVPHRGTRVFAAALEKVLACRQNVEVTIAGRGPDEEYLHKSLDKWGGRIEFMQYISDESLTIHADKHIAIIPTVGSEGTSLSLLEAMSAQCAVICTNVGGITNIVIDGYNGVMVSAGNIEQLADAIIELIDDEEKRNRLAATGYDTVKYAFSHDRWAEKWMHVIEYASKVEI